MEKLAICSKVLYDHDILNKQEEINNFKKDLIQPIIYFNNQKEFDYRKKDMIQKLELEINKWYKEDDIMDCFMDYDIGQCFETDLYTSIYDVLKDFFNDSKWLSNVVYYMCIGFEATIVSCIKKKLNKKMRDSIPNIIYMSVIEQLNKVVFEFHSDKFFRFRDKK